MKTILSLAGLGLAGTMAFAGWFRSPEPAPTPAPVAYTQTVSAEGRRDWNDDRDRTAYDRDDHRYRGNDRYYDRDDQYRRDDRYGDRDDRSRFDRQRRRDRDDHDRR